MILRRNAGRHRKPVADLPIHPRIAVEPRQEKVAGFEGRKSLSQLVRVVRKLPPPTEAERTSPYALIPTKLEMSLPDARSSFRSTTRAGRVVEPGVSNTDVNRILKP